MSKDLRKSREQRQRILQTVSEIVAKDTLGTITLDDIASKMGSSKGTIYYYFKSKGELLYHLHMYAADIAEDAVYPVLDDNTIPPRERLERMIYTHVLVICKHWQLWRCFWWDIGLKETPRDLARIVRRRNVEYLVKVADLVEQVNKTEGRTSAAPTTMARILFDLVHSASRWYKTNGSLSAEEVAALIVKCATDGLFPRPSTTSTPICDRTATAIGETD